MLGIVDDQRLGMALRAARLRRGWTQAEVARRAEVRESSISRLERGFVDQLRVAAVRRVAAALEVRIGWIASARGGYLDRLLNARHAAMVEQLLARLAATSGWTGRPEVSFAHFGERGSIDVVGWHEASRTLLVIEVKTEIVDPGEILRRLDVKRRLAGVAVGELGWRPAAVATWLAVAESTTTRRRVAAHARSFGAALPADGRALERWLRQPQGGIAALSFLPDRRPGMPSTGLATVRRVRRPRSDDPRAAGDPVAAARDQPRPHRAG